MTRRPTRGVLLSLVLLLSIPAVASAQTPAERANQLNEEGKDLFRNGDLNGAAMKFQQAIVMSPEGRFYFNLCYILERQGKFEDALTACNAVVPNGADAKLEEKTNKLIGQIQEKMPQAGGDVGPGTGDPAVGTGEPGTTEPNPDPGTPGYQGAPPTGQPMDPGDSQLPPPEQAGAYTWSLGAALGAVNRGTVGRDNDYASSGGKLSLYSDFQLMPTLQAGLQAYLNFSSFPGDFVDDSLEMVDVGGAVYKHFHFGQFEVTPLVGLQISLMQPVSLVSDESLVALGLRADAALSYAFGAYREHVLSLTPSLNFYSPATDSTDTIRPRDFGLDEPGRTFTLSLGYSYRFTTPFGTTTIFTLE